LAQVAGRWRSFLEQLINLYDTLMLAHPLPEWIVLFNQVIDRFFLAEPAEVDNLVRLRQQLAALASDAALAPFDQPLALSVVRDALETRLYGASAARFMSGGVTFATLAHGRCLPAKLVCLVGMNSEHFPGRDSGHGLDQMQTQRP
jgi:exodeoxyribonuclease V gamma subunit